MAKTKLIKSEMLTLDEFVGQHMNLVHSISQKYKRHGQFLGVDYEDIVNIGVIGLIKAYKDFDNSYDVSISTYTFPKISGEIQRGLRDINPGLKFSRSIKLIASQLTEQNTDPLEVSKRLGVSKRMAKGAIEYKVNVRPVSINYEVKDGKGNSLKIEDLIINMPDETNVFVDEFIKSLDDRKKVVINGLLNNKSQREIGQEINCSQCHVSRLIKKIGEQYQAYTNEGYRGKYYDLCQSR